MTFCPRCGKTAVDVFCEDCLRHDKPLLASVKPLSLVHCSSCDRIKISNQWQPASKFDRFLKKHIEFQKNALIETIEFPIPALIDKPRDFELPVTVTGTVSSKIEPYEESYEIHIPILYEDCDRCSLAKSSYFEGILQVRKPNDKIINYIDEQVQNNPEVQITSAKDVKGGIDYYVTDQKFLQQFVYELKKRFGGEVKTQSKLHTYDHQRSKPVYRLTTLIRLPEFGVGDIIETDKKLIQITRMGSNISGFDLRNRKKTALPCPLDDDVLQLEPVEVVISSVKPKLKILSPDDYQEVQVSHTTNNVEPGTNTMAVQDSKNKWYLLGDKE